MSATLAYRRTPVTPPKTHYGSSELKFIFIEKYKLHDGSHTLTPEDIPYLEGLRDGGHKDAGKMIDCIKKYGGIEIYLSY